jgi:hypothetical protein
VGINCYYNLSEFFVFLEFKTVGMKATIKICQICFVLSKFKL